MDNGKILVTGGAGYIGSHVVRQLGANGENVITLDNLSTGFEAAVTSGELIIGDTGDAALLDRIFDNHDIDTVMHFAAHTIVPESVSDPLKYYGNNTASSRTLLERAHAHGVKHVVFSSTAAVYGIPPEGAASEATATRPINPYGSSKLMTEWMLRDLAIAGGPTYVALRYFNVAGCEPGGSIGQSTPKATLLIKVACEAAVGIRPGVSIFGTDFPRPTAPVCVTTFMLKTWPAHISMRSTTSGMAASRRRLTVATATATASARSLLPLRKQTVRH
jgi:UDP-glucose 4-epimerase